MTNNLVLETKSLSKSYTQGNQEYEILKDVNFALKKGEVLGLVGPSGSGKTSLLNMLGMLDSPTTGEVFINGVETSKMGDAQKTKCRGENIGFVFQFHHLFQDFTAIENVMFPLRIQGINSVIAKQKALYILDKMGLSDRLNNYPSQLSGGEQQRVSIARAIVFNPKILIADEPTGNLDQENAQKVFNMLMDLVRSYGISIILATHDSNIANQIPKKIKIENKKLLEF